MRIARSLPLGLLLLLSGAGSCLAATADQSQLAPVINAGTRQLKFDWPTIRIGTGEYAEGPTGVTVVHFGRRSFAAVDVRGGGPGTVNTDYLRQGYDLAELDAVVFAGGTWYGLETVTAVGTALKDDGVRDGDWENIALSVGAIIYDLGPRRLNEIYPDKRLAQAAFRAARPGVFPLGAQGAGRFAKTGGLFGCNAYSGQGAAYRQIGELKIAAFAVVNALGVVTTRDGRVAACYRDSGWPADLRTSQLLASYPASGKPGSTLAPPAPGSPRNTTVSLVVVNQKLAPADLQRLATHVHSSMSRAIQPFATEFDGDVLYAVSTGEWEPTGDKPGWPGVEIDVVAAELMWDAILSSVPEQPEAVPSTQAATTPQAPPAAQLASSQAADLARFTGDYSFSPHVTVRLSMQDGKLVALATGPRDAYRIGRTGVTSLLPVTTTQFTVPGRYPLVLDLSTPDTLVINPGHWQQVGRRTR